MNLGKMIRKILFDILLHIPKKTRATWHVDGTNGSDANDGNRPERAFATVGAAINAAAAGDLLKIAEDTYDETISVPAGLAGLEIICEPGTIFVNTGAATVVAIAAPNVKLKGAQITQAGQIGLAVTGADFIGEDIKIVGCTTSFDMDAASPVLKRCLSILHTVTGFDLIAATGVYINCLAVGAGATRGYYLSHTNAENNTFIACHSLNNTAAGYEAIAGADSNLFSFCSQSSLCAGPTDAGANNTWASHSEDSQITAGNTLQEDLAALETLVDDIETDTDPLVMGKSQIAPTTIDLNQAAASYDLFTGTTQAVILESLNFKCPTGDAGGALTSISIQTDDATPQVIISAADGVVGNLTSEADISWTGSLYITVGTKIRLTIAGGAHGAGYVCNVTAKVRAVVSGGYLA